MPGYKRPKTFKIDMNEADKLLLEKLAKRHKLSQKEIVGYLVGLCDKYNLMKGDWQSRLEGEDQARQRYTKLDNACGNMTFAKDDYICVRAVLGKPPNIKKLSDIIEQALDICAICEEDTRKKLDRDLTLERVKELELQLQEKSSKKFKIPQCRQGARLDGEGLSFEGCPRSRAKPVSIEGYCNKLNDGQGCTMFKTQLVGVST